MTRTAAAPGTIARTATAAPSGVCTRCGPSTAKGSLCSPSTTARIACGSIVMRDRERPTRCPRCWFYEAGRRDALEASCASSGHQITLQTFVRPLWPRGFRPGEDWIDTFEQSQRRLVRHAQPERCHHDLRAHAEAKAGHVLLQQELRARQGVRQLRDALDFRVERRQEPLPLRSHA